MFFNLLNFFIEHFDKVSFYFFLNLISLKNIYPIFIDKRLVSFSEQKFYIKFTSI